LESQEDFLIKENKKHVKVKNAYAQEVEKCENLTKELSICHDSIIGLRNENASLNAKIDELNDTISSLRTKNDSLMSHPVLEGKPNANHVRVRIRNSRTQRLHK
jgi:predicted nuclease with TOPRIM domain